MRETPIETLNYYALIASKIMRQPLDDNQRAALVAHVHRVLPDTALQELSSESAMKLALAVTFEAMPKPRSLAAANRSVARPAAAQPS